MLFLRRRTGAAGLRGLMRFFVRRRGLQDGFDLVEMVEVVAGHHVEEALDAFFAAFGVQAVMFPLFGLEGFEDGEVRFADGAKDFDALAGIAFVVAASGDPGVLIVGLDRRAGRSEDAAKAPGGDDLCVAEVG